MESAPVNRFNLEIAVFLKQLKAFGAHKNGVQLGLGRKTVALLMDTVATINDLTANRTINEFIEESSVDFLLDLNNRHFVLRQYIMCRLCLEETSIGYDEFLTHLHKRYHLNAAYGGSLNANREEVNVTHSASENRPSYAEVLLGAMSNGSQSKMVTSKPSSKVLHKGVEQLNRSTVSKDKSEHFNGDSTHLIQLRGLSWAVTKKEIQRFLAGANILNDLDGIHFIINDEVQFGQAFVQLASSKDYLVAQKKHRKLMVDDDVRRCIEVLGASTDHFKRLISKRNALLDDKIVRIDNLRVGTTETDIRVFLDGSQIDAVHMVYYDGDESILKEMFVQFSGVDDADAIIKRNGEIFQNRKIKVYRSSEYQMQCRLTDYQIDYTMQKDYNGAEYVARIIGLPFSVGKRYIIHLFNGLKIDENDGIQIELDRLNRRTGIAFVEFESSEDLRAALNANVKKVNKFLRVNKSSKKKFLEVKNLNASLAQRYGSQLQRY